MPTLDAARRAPPPAAGDWATYNGDRAATATRAAADHARQRRRPAARLDVRRARRPRYLRSTPLVVDGVMYVSAPNEVYRARRPHRQADLAVPPSAHAGRDRRRRRGRQSWRGAAGRPAVHGHRRCAHRGAASRQRPGAVGRRDGRLPQALRRDVGAAGRRRSRRLRRLGRRRGHPRLRRGLRRGDGPRGLAVLDGAGARRAGSETWKGRRSSTAAPPRG